MALTDLTRISTSGIATGSTIDAPILRKDVSFRGSQVGVTSALFDSSDDALEFNDNVKLTFGNGGDLELYHNNESIISHSGAGVFKIQGNGANNTFLRAKNAQNSITLVPDGEVILHNNGTPRFETSGSGAIVTGILTATSFSGPMVGNANNSSGISTFYDLRVSNNLTVEGTTTTLDTNLIGVDRIEVGANSNTVTGIAVTQSGTADILRLYDGASQVVTVDDTGKVGIGTDNPGELLDVYKTSNSAIIRVRTTTAGAWFEADSASSGYSGLKLSSGGTGRWFVGSYGTNNFTIKDGSSSGGDERFTIVDGSGNIGISSAIPTEKLDVIGNIKASGTINATTFVGALTGTASGNPTLTDGANNRVVTATGANTLTGETGLTYDTQALRLNNTAANPQFHLTSADNGISELKFGDQSDLTRAVILYRSGSAGDALCFNGYNNSERLRILSDGKVGIGTDTATAKLEITDAIGTTGEEVLLKLQGRATKNVYLDINADANRRGVIRFKSAGTDKWSIGRGDSDELSDSSFFIATGNSGGNTAKLAITSGGAVGINASNPQSKLDVYEASTGQSETQKRIAIFRKNGNSVGDEGYIHLTTMTGHYGVKLGFVNEGASPTYLNQGFFISTVNGNENITNHTKKFVIKSDGKIGIGITNPQKLLELQHIPNRKLQFSYDDNIITMKGANNNGNPETIRLIGGNSIRFHTGTTGSGDEALRIDQNGNSQFGGFSSGGPWIDTNAMNVIDLGSGTMNRGLGWGGTTANYANIWTEYSSGDLNIATGLRMNNNTSNTYVSSYGGGALGRANIELGTNGIIRVRNAASGTVANGTEVTALEERLRIETSGEIQLNDSTVRYENTGGNFNQVRHLSFPIYFSSGTTHTVLTIGGSLDSGFVCFAVLEYIGLYGYAGTDMSGGVRRAFTRRTNNNTAWRDFDDQVSENIGENRRPDIEWDSGVLKVTTPSSTQITGYITVTAHANNMSNFTLTRN